MTSKRRKYTPAEQLALTTQVGGVCPLCGIELFYRKKSNSYKHYELAHIYPLNPTEMEREELVNEELLDLDVNHPNNQLPLCPSCHSKYDKPRTKEEYRVLLKKKKEFIRQDEQREIQKRYFLEEDIQAVIESLYSAEANDTEGEIEYNPKKIDSKFNDSMPQPTRRKIKHNVADYYSNVKTKFLELERDNPTISESIALQVKAFYLNQKRLGYSQTDVFFNIVEWIHSKTNPKTIEAAEIVTSYFIQNCEVFE